MTKAASVPELQELHKAVAKHLTARLQEADGEDAFLLDAATLGCAIKFLKDNNVSADPANADDLDKLREQLTNATKERQTRRVGNVVQLAAGDYKAMEG